MRVLGVDPGTAVMGYGVVERCGSRLHHVASGALRARGTTIAEKLHSLHDGLVALIELWQPEQLALEEVFYHRNVKTAVRLGQGQAAALVAAGSAGLPVVCYSPTKVKLAVVGNGRAHKQQVQAMVCRLLALDPAPGPLDVTDALAVALCHIHRARVRVG